MHNSNVSLFSVGVVITTASRVCGCVITTTTAVTAVMSPQTAVSAADVTRYTRDASVCIFVCTIE